jgi:hypothetical protein
MPGGLEAGTIPGMETRSGHAGTVVRGA